MPLLTRWSTPILMSLFTVLLACGGNGSRSSNGETAPARPAPQHLTINGVKLAVEIVQDPESRARGLMHREALPENSGMLFVFQSTQYLSFWMRNTFIPLDIAFIDEEGIIVDIQTMAPLDESKQYISTAPAIYALEVNASWFTDNGIKVGDRVQF